MSTELKTSFPPLGAHLSLQQGKVSNIFNIVDHFNMQTFACFLQQKIRWNPRNLSAKKTLSDAAEFKAGLKKRGISANNVIIHAPYIINIASPKEDVRKKSLVLLENELKTLKTFGLRWSVLHPGSSVKGSGQTAEEGIQKIIDGLNHVLDATAKDYSDCGILLENNAGGGACLGTTFTELKAMRDGVVKEHRHRVAYCVDTCHAWASGYDIDDLKDDIENEGIDLKNIKAFHFNDSKTPQGSKKDRHADHTCGTIPHTDLKSLYNDSEFVNVPFIMEIPCSDIGLEQQMLLMFSNNIN